GIDRLDRLNCFLGSSHILLERQGGEINPHRVKTRIRCFHCSCQGMRMVGIEKDRDVRFLAQALHQSRQLAYPKEFSLSLRRSDEYRKPGLSCGCDDSLQQDLVRDIEMAEGGAFFCQLRQNVVKRFLACAPESSKCRHCCSLSLRYRRIRVLVELS